MREHDTGGPAFPNLSQWNDARMGYSHEGMTLRDYAAIHSTEPGISEVVAWAGLVWRSGKVWLSETEAHSFDAWWESIPLGERLDIAANVRYAQADAMLSARKGPR